MKSDNDANDPKQTTQDHSFNEKRKWQIALRRYVINRSKGVDYAPYFGIDTEGFRNWIESQFDESMNWDNFSTVWHFEHVIPLAYFDLHNDADLRLCWSFINIRAEKLSIFSRTHKTHIHSTKDYFETLYQQTGLQLCILLVNKINSIHFQQLLPTPNQLLFLQTKVDDLKVMADFSAYEFERLNSGDNIATLIAEQALMKRFG